jgi:carbonic anhydrase
MIIAGCHRKADIAPETSTQKPSARPVHWGYQGELAPSNWGALSPAYAACAEGKSQSPVDLIADAGGGMPTLIFDYQKTVLKIAHHEHVIDIVDNGHTIQVTVDAGSSLITSRDEYELLQFHFHTPSEHTVGGRSFPMEAHFVHQSKSGNFAVVSALFEAGAANENLARLIAHFPATKGESRHAPEVVIDLSAHLPTDRSVFSYLGSFTTPPCTENVEWFVLKQPVPASLEQLTAFTARLSPNNRPIQGLNGRRMGLGQVNPKTQP